MAEGRPDDCDVVFVLSVPLEKRTIFRGTYIIENSSLKVIVKLFFLQEFPENFHHR